MITQEGIDLLRRMWPIYARGIATYFGQPYRRVPTLRSVLDGIADAATSGGQ